MSRINGWRCYLLELSAGDPEVASRTAALRSLLEPTANASRRDRLAALEAVAAIPPSPRLILLPGIGRLVGDDALEVRLAAQAALFECVEPSRIPTSVRRALQRLVSAPCDEARRGLLDPLLRWCARRDPPATLAALPLVAQPLAALSLLGPACALETRPQPGELPAPDHFRDWLTKGHLLLRATVVDWLSHCRWLGPGARELLSDVWARDVDPFVAVPALRGWARRCPPPRRLEAMRHLQAERRTLRGWSRARQRGLLEPSVPLTAHQQVEMISAATVLAMADLAGQSTALAEIAISELEHRPQPSSGRPRVPYRFDLEPGLGAGATREDNLFIYRILEATSKEPPWLRGRRVGASNDFDLGLPEPVTLRGADADDLWFVETERGWRIRARVRDEGGHPQDLADRFSMAAMRAPPGTPPRHVATWFRTDAEDRDGWLSAGCTAADILLRGQVSAPQRERLVRLLVEMGSAAHQPAVPRLPNHPDHHPLRRLRNKFAQLLLSGDAVGPDAFGPEHELALTRLCASALRSPPSHPTYHRWITEAEERLEDIALGGALDQQALARFVLAVHRRSFERPLGPSRVTFGDVGRRAEMVPFLDDADVVRAAESTEWSAINVWGHLELVARAVERDDRPVPEASLTLLMTLSRPTLGARSESARELERNWRVGFERLSVRLALAWAQAARPPRQVFVPLFETVLREMSTAALEVMLSAWNEARGRWWEDRWLVARLTWKAMSATLSQSRSADSRSITDRADRRRVIGRVLDAEAEAGRIVPLWFEARKHGHADRSANAQPGHLAVLEHGASRWIVEGAPSGAFAFVRRTEGASELPCLVKTPRPAAGPTQLFVLEDVLVGLLTDVEHPDGHLNQIRLVEAVDNIGYFAAEGPRSDLPAIRLQPGELLDADGRPMRLEQLEPDTILHVMPHDDDERRVLRCRDIDTRLPRLARLFRAGNQVDVIKTAEGLRFAMEDAWSGSITLPRPVPDPALARALEHLQEGASRAVRVSKGWTPHHLAPSTGGPPDLEVELPRGERRFMGAETVEALQRLLDLAPGDLLTGDVFDGSAQRGWRLDGLPLRLTLGAEHLSPPARAGLAPPFRVASIQTESRAVEIDGQAPIEGVVMSRQKNSVLVRTLPDLTEISLPLTLDLDLGDLVTISPQGVLYRRRLEIEVCPLVATVTLADAWRPGAPLVVRYLGIDTELDEDDDGEVDAPGWITCRDSSTMVILPAEVIGGLAPPPPLVDLEIDRTNEGWRVTPLPAVGLAAAVGEPVHYRSVGEGRLALGTRPELIFKTDRQPPREALLGPIEIELDHAGPHLVARLFPPHLGGPHADDRGPSLLGVLKAAGRPQVLPARCRRRPGHPSWLVNARGHGARALQMSDEEFSWERTDRNFWQGPALFWLDHHRICASLRRTPPWRLAEWLEERRIWDTGSKPLYYEGLISPSLREFWGLPPGPELHLLEVQPGEHLAVSSSCVRLGSLAPGDRILRYRILGRSSAPTLQPLSVELEFANRVRQFHRQGALLRGAFYGGRLEAITDPHEREHPVGALAYTVEVDDAPGDADGELSVEFVRQEGSTIVFRVVRAEQVLQPGNLLLVEVVERTGSAHRSALVVRTAEGLLAEVPANDYSVDRMRLGATAVSAGTILLCRVESAPEGERRARLSCTDVPSRPVDSLMHGRDGRWVTVGRDSRRKHRALQVEVEPGWRVTIPAGVFADRRLPDVWRGDRLLLRPRPRDYRVEIVARDDGPWRRLSRGTPVMVQPWASLADRRAQWAKNKTINGHVIGATGVPVLLYGVPPGWLHVEGPLPAVLRDVKSSLGQVGADFAPAVDEWVAGALHYDQIGPYLQTPGRRIEYRWGDLSRHEGPHHRALIEHLERGRWRTEPGRPEVRVLGAPLFVHAQTGRSPVRYGIDHVLEQFDEPGGDAGGLRDFVVAQVNRDGLEVEITPGRHAEIPWAHLRLDGPTATHARPWLDPDGLGPGDVLGLRRGDRRGLRVVRQRVGALRRMLHGVVVQIPSPPRLGPSALRVVSSFAGAVDPQWSRVRLGAQRPTRATALHPNDVIFLMVRRGRIVVHGFDELHWRWAPDPGDPLCDADGPGRELVAAVGALPCTVESTGPEGLVLSRRLQIGALLEDRPGAVRWARFIAVRNGTSMLVEISGIPWVLTREQWCWGPVNLTSRAIGEVLERRADFEVTRDAEGCWSAAAMRPRPTSQLDARVIAESNGLLVEGHGILGFVTPDRVGYAQLGGLDVRQLFGIGTTLQLAFDEDDRLAAYATSAVQKDLDWLRSNGGPIRVIPIWPSGDIRTPTRLGRLPSELLVGLSEGIDQPIAAWVQSFQPSRRRLLMRPTPVERRWDIHIPDLEARLGALSHPGAPGPLPHLQAAVAAIGEEDTEAAHRHIQRLWAQLRAQAHRTLMLPHPRHRQGGPVEEAIMRAQGLVELPTDHRARLAALQTLFAPPANRTDSSAEATRCWLTRLAVDTLDREGLLAYQQGLDRLLWRLQAETWDGLAVEARAWVTAAALSFSRGEVQEGLDALLAWDGQDHSEDPWIDAARFWRRWVSTATSAVEAAPVRSSGAFLAEVERLASAEALDGSEVLALASAWDALALTWLVEPLDLTLAGAGEG